MGHIIVHQQFKDLKGSVRVDSSFSREILTERELEDVRLKYKYEGLLHWAIEWPGQCIIAQSKGWQPA